MTESLAPSSVCVGKLIIVLALGGDQDGRKKLLVKHTGDFSMGQTDNGIIRTFRKRHNFVIIDKTALEDTRLSYKARGMLAYLLSKPDNWTTNTQNLINQSEKDGREAILSGLKELEGCGYLLRKKYKDRAGRFGWEVIIFETLGDRSEWETTLSIDENSSTINGFPVDGKTGDGKSGDGKPGYILNKESTTPKELINDSEITHKSGAHVCEPQEDLTIFSEPEEAHSDEKLKQVADQSTNVEDKKEIFHVANQSSDSDQRSAAAQSSKKSNNGNCWQCPQPELRIEFLKWRSQGMGKGATITKASNWCNKYPESANDSFAEFLESRKPSEPQPSLDSPLQAFLTGCGDKLRGIVLNNDFTPEQLNYIAELWEAGRRREELTILLLKKEGLIAS